MSLHTSRADPESKGLLRVVVTVDTQVVGWELLAKGGAIGENPSIGGCELILNPSEPVDADFWIVFANARPRDVIRCAPENTLFIAGEPEEKKIYPKGFYRQFHRIIDTHEASGHPRVSLHAPCLAWHAGLDHRTQRFRLGYKELNAIECPEVVENKVSVICSDAAFTPGQRERLVFLEELKAHLGDKLIHFGRGFHPVDDKMEAIQGFRFHLVMENCRVPHYWTEKISDAYLGWAFPLYVGSPNLNDYFPRGSFCPLDIGSPAEAAGKIQALLSLPRDQVEKDAVGEGRRRVLEVYNPWVAWARWAQQYHIPDLAVGDTLIRSHKAFRPFPRGLAFRLANR